jgi:hypothetical protein
MLLLLHFATPITNKCNRGEWGQHFNMVLLDGGLLPISPAIRRNYRCNVHHQARGKTESAFACHNFSSFRQVRLRVVSLSPKAGMHSSSAIS